MNIKINDSIRKKYMAGFMRSSEPNEIVIHGTGGGSSADAMIKWMMGGERGAEYTRGIALYHYLVDFDGTVLEIIDPDNWVYHSSSGAHDKTTIGIELMNKTSGNTDGYSDKQYKSLFDLIDQLMKKYKIKNIVGHGYNGKKYSNMDKNCPGNFDWEKLGKNLADNGYGTEYESRHFTINLGDII